MFFRKVNCLIPSSKYQIAVANIAEIRIRTTGKILQHSFLFFMFSNNRTKMQDTRKKKQDTSCKHQVKRWQN